MAEMGDGLVRLDRMGSVAVVVLAHPPANLWSAGTEAALLAALTAAEADTSIAAIVLRGEGRGFSAGLALEDALDMGLRAGLARACARIEACSKPVIAAIHGMALGAGCALALAAHWRIAHEAAMIGLPEVGLGLVPGGGATQRLPRLVGLEQALRLGLAARPIPAAEALAIGLVDEVATGVLGQAALAMAARGPAPRRLSDRMPSDLARLSAILDAARAEVAASPLPAPLRLVDCIEAAGLLPFEMGQNLESAAFEDLSATPEAAGLIHALRVERAALQQPVEIAGQVAPEVVSVGLLGAGGFAADFALQAVRAGVEVVLVDPDRAALTSALATVVGGLDAEVAAGRMDAPGREAAWARMAAGQGDSLPEGLDLVLEEPGVESGAHAVLGAAALGAGLTLAEGPGGLAELAIGPSARPETLARLSALARRLGWRAVPVGPGGPVELGLRLALEAATEALSPALGAEVALAALGAAGIGQAAPGALPAMPPQGSAVLRAVLAALAAEGARMLEDGRARRAGDIDAIAVLSGLMPRWLGGPMHQADRRGLLVLRADLRKLGPAPVFAVPALVDRLIADGARLGE